MVDVRDRFDGERTAFLKLVAIKSELGQDKPLGIGLCDDLSSIRGANGRFNAAHQGSLVIRAERQTWYLPLSASPH